MAPPPEYDKEPKAPDKSATTVVNEDSNVHTIVNELQTISDQKAANTTSNNEFENNKHVETLDDGQLRALLDEAIQYKCPKDREGKSSLFKELLEEVEHQEESEASRAFTGGRGTHANSLQDLMAALKVESAQRPNRHHHPQHSSTPVSARAIHGGSLPSGVDTSFLVAEEPARGGYLATVRCVNPPPLAERRVSASDANCPAEVELLNKRSKPMFPMYTARATLEIGSGSVCSGRAVTTTTASNQVRTRPHKSPASRRKRFHNRTLTRQVECLRPVHWSTTCGPPERMCKTKNLYNPEKADPNQVKLMSALRPKQKDGSSGGGCRIKKGNDCLESRPRGLDVIIEEDTHGSKSKYQETTRSVTNDHIHANQKLNTESFIYTLDKWYEGLRNYGYTNSSESRNYESFFKPQIINTDQNIQTRAAINSAYTNTDPNIAKHNIAEGYGSCPLPHLNATSEFVPIQSSKINLEEIRNEESSCNYKIHKSNINAQSSQTNYDIDKPSYQTHDISEYRKKVGKLERASIYSVNPRNVRSMTIGRPMNLDNLNDDTLNCDMNIIKKDKEIDTKKNKKSKKNTKKIKNHENTKKNPSSNDSAENEKNKIVETKNNQKEYDEKNIKAKASKDNSKCLSSEKHITSPNQQTEREFEMSTFSRPCLVAENSNDIELIDISYIQEKRSENDSFFEYVDGQKKLFQALESSDRVNVDENNVLLSSSNVEDKEEDQELAVETKNQLKSSNINIDIGIKKETMSTNLSNKGLDDSEQSSNCQVPDDNLNVKNVQGNITRVEENVRYSDNNEVPDVKDTDVEHGKVTSNIKNENSKNTEYLSHMQVTDTECCETTAHVDVTDSKSYEIVSHNTNTAKKAGDQVILAELPNNSYIFLTFPKRLLTQQNKNEQSVKIHEIENNNVEPYASGENSVVVKAKKNKKKTSLGSSSDDKKKDAINKNALRVLLFESLFKRDSAESGKQGASSIAANEVDSAIPFSCITTPEVVASCNTTSSTSQAAVAVDPKPLQLGSCYRAVTSLVGESPAPRAPPPPTADSPRPPPQDTPRVKHEQPRSVISSTFNGLPLSRPNYGSTASATSEEYKKSLDENGNAVQGISSPISGSSQHKKPRRKKSSKNETVIKSHQIDGYQGNKDLNEVLRFIESNADSGRNSKLSRSKHKDDSDDKGGKKRSTERRKDKESKMKRATSMEELSRTKLEDLTDAGEPPLRADKERRDPPAKAERRSWGDSFLYHAEPEPEPAPELTDFQTVTKRRKPRRRLDEPEQRRARPPSPRDRPRRESAPPSDRSNDSNDDMDSVHSLPAEATRTALAPAPAPLVSAPPPAAPHASYADIARTRHNIPDLIESCNFYAEGESGTITRRTEPASTPGDADGYPALEARAGTGAGGGGGAPQPARPRPKPGAVVVRRDRKERPAPPPPECPAPDVVADRRPPVILLDSTARPRDMDGVTFGFDINEQLLGGPARRPRCDLVRDAPDSEPTERAEPADRTEPAERVEPTATAVPVHAGCLALRYVPPDPPPDTHHLHQIIDYVGGAWEDVIRCTGKVRYFSE